jgi:hypothetical protein
MENTTKLWKVVVEISRSRGDGNGESRRETKTRYFEDFRDAEHFADSGDLGFFEQVVSRHIYEYDISSVRELERKKHEVVREVKDITWVWE